MAGNLAQCYDNVNIYGSLAGNFFRGNQVSVKH